MSEKIYVVTLDASDPKFDLNSVRKFVKEDDDISAWWNHIPGVFFIATDLGPRSLSRRLKRRVGDVRFVAVEVLPEHMGGYLPERSWRWFVNRFGKALDDSEIGRSG